jgi:hypothetical protein
MIVAQTERLYGVSFEIAELLLIQAWAEFHGLHLTVELDHSFDDQEYEEVISLFRKGSVFRRCIIWRAPTAIVVQPIIGRSSRFASMADALDSFRPIGPEAPLSDIAPATRPGAPFETGATVGRVDTQFPSNGDL